MSTSTYWTPDAVQNVPMTVLRFWFWAVALGVAFFVVEHDFRLLHTTFWDEDVYTFDEYAEMISHGNVQRQVAFLSLGLLGCYGLVSRNGRSIAWNQPLFLLCIAFLAWSVMSVAWSVDPQLTLRREVRLLCILAASLGLARQLAPRSFLRIAFIVSLAWLVASFAGELGVAKFRPWDHDYRFAGMMHPNLQALYCSVLALSAIALLHETGWTGWARPATLLVAMLGLFLTRSRTALIAWLAALAVLWLVTRSRRKVPILLAAGLGASVAAFVVASIGVTEKQIGDALLLGRSEGAGSLTGRVPLWQELMRFVRERPLAGYGYGAFWNPDRSEAVAESVGGWVPPHAHSSYLDALLALGIVGAGAFVLMLSLALIRAARQYRRVPDAPHAFLLALLTFGCINAIAESSVMEPSLFYFLMTCGIFQLTFIERSQTPADDADDYEMKAG